MSAMPTPSFGAERAANAPLRAPVELRELLSDARARGLPFSPTFSFAVHTATSGRPDGEMWRDVFSATRDAWRRAYDRQPATGPERAVAVLVADVVLGGEELPDRPCGWCGGNIASRHANTSYCSAGCRKLAATARERHTRTAA